MYQYEKNHIEINNHSYDFEFDIRAVIEHKEKYVVLLAIPFNKTEINNIGLQNIPNKEKLDAFKKRLNDINPKFIATMHGFCINCE